jgi:hypothetical protein
MSTTSAAARMASVMAMTSGIFIFLRNRYIGSNRRLRKNAMISGIRILLAT